MIAHAPDYRKYLDPSVLARISGLELRARLLVQGFISGMHRSPLRGVSIEFAEYRKYAQGDDLRHLDWKVFGRTDKHYIKQYEQETNLHLLLLVDCSESMSYRSAGSAMSKRDYAVTAAAAMAYLALQQADAVAVATFDGTLHRTTRTTNHPTAWKKLVHELEQAPAGPRTAFRGVLDEVADSLHPRHMVVLLSDLLGDVADVLMGLKHLRHRRHEPMVFHVLDHAEIEFPFDAVTQFEGLESAGRLRTEPRAIRARYLEEFREYAAALRHGCHEQRIDYEMFDTRLPLSAALSTYLATRATRV